MATRQPVSRNRRRLATACCALVFVLGLVQAVRGWRGGDHVLAFVGALQAVSALSLLVLRVSEERQRRNAAREPRSQDDR